MVLDRLSFFYYLYRINMLGLQNRNKKLDEKIYPFDQLTLTTAWI